MHFRRHLAPPWLGSICLAFLHAAVLLGVLQQREGAIAAATYLESWPVAEGVSLVVTPYFLFLNVPEHSVPRWQRALWLPLAILVLLGIGGTIRLLRATWIYVLAKVPMLWAARRSSLRASVGCLGASAAFVLLAVLATVFLNRPTQWPIGTLVGDRLKPEERLLANTMAYAVGYFGLLGVADIVVQQAFLRRRSR